MNWRGAGRLVKGKSGDDGGRLKKEHAVVLSAFGSTLKTAQLPIKVLFLFRLILLL